MSGLDHHPQPDRAGVRLVEELGYRRIGTIGYVSVGPWRRDFCRMRDGASVPGAGPG